MATFETVVKVMKLLQQTKPGADVKDGAVEAYALVLEPVPDEVLMKAAVLLAREPGAFLPDAGTIYSLAADLMDAEPPADEAWLLVKKHSRSASLGAANPVRLAGRAAEALRLMGGDLGWMENDMPFLEKRFKEAYERLRQAERRGAALALPGGESAKMLE